MDKDLICPHCGSDDIEKGYDGMCPAFFCGECWRFICYRPETWEDYGLYIDDLNMWGEYR